MSDIIQKIGKTIIQHGKENDRIYLMRLSGEGFPGILKDIQDLAAKNSYSKIFAKIPEWAKDEFRICGYEQEAYVPNFYGGREAACFMAKYLDSARSKMTDGDLIANVLARAKAAKLEQVKETDGSYSFEILTPEDAHDMAELYSHVFDTYPFPIHSAKYLSDTMNEHIIYFGARHGGALAAVSSCEMDREAKNVEMTDFATLPEHRGRGLALYLLENMEKEMKERGILTSYTIARACSYGMNATFAKSGYIFTGTLINNTNISGGIESMNVWYKSLQEDD